MSAGELGGELGALSISHLERVRFPCCDMLRFVDSSHSTRLRR
jgi:hypothetical protein